MTHSLQKPAGQEIQEEQYDIPYHWFFVPYEWRGRNYFGYTGAAIALLKKYNKEFASAKVLDAGCGDGRLVKMLHDAGIPAVTGLDYSESALRFARVFLPETTFYTGDFTQYETLEAAGTYDAIFLIETLEHIEVASVPKVLENLAKMLKEDGLLIITVPSVHLPLHDKHYQHFTADSLTQATDDHFSCVEVGSYNSIRKLWLRMIYKLLDNRFYDVKPLTRWFNTVVYPRHLNIDVADQGLGVIGVFRKK